MPRLTSFTSSDSSPENSSRRLLDLGRDTPPPPLRNGDEVDKIIINKKYMQRELQISPKRVCSIAKVPSPHNGLEAKGGQKKEKQQQRVPADSRSTTSSPSADRGPQRTIRNRQHRADAAQSVIGRARDVGEPELGDATVAKRKRKIRDERAAIIDISSVRPEEETAGGQRSSMGRQLLKASTTSQAQLANADSDGSDVLDSPPSPASSSPRPVQYGRGCRKRRQAQQTAKAQKKTKKVAATSSVPLGPQSFVVPPPNLTGMTVEQVYRMRKATSRPSIKERLNELYMLTINKISDEFTEMKGQMNVVLHKLEKLEKKDEDAYEYDGDRMGRNEEDGFEEDRGGPGMEVGVRLDGDERSASPAVDDCDIPNTPPSGEMPMVSMTDSASDLIPGVAKLMEQVYGRLEAELGRQPPFLPHSRKVRRTVQRCLLTLLHNTFPDAGGKRFQIAVSIDSMDGSVSQNGVILHKFNSVRDYTRTCGVSREDLIDNIKQSLFPS